MILYLENHTYKYETEKVCRIFFPTEKIFFVSDGTEDVPDDDDKIYTRITRSDAGTSFYCRAEINGKTAERTAMHTHSDPVSDWDEEKLLAKVTVSVLSEMTGIVPPWGILTGVRPSKLMRTYIKEVGEDRAQKSFTDFFGVTKEKTDLAFNVAKAEEKCISLSRPDSFSLYVSIPFCPTRCSYCSFVSHSIAGAKKLIPDYVRLLCEEIKLTAEAADKAGLHLETVYIGGGTPTTLCADDLFTLTNALKANFPMESVREFTVEAGRPDTVDKEKLLVLKNAGVSRISINPQTFSDSVLRAIGRAHSADDTLEKYALAKSLGFDNINTDLIAGLPTDTLDGFKDSIDKAIALSPANITVHTLALKRASGIVTGKEERSVSLMTADMLTYGNKKLYENGYFPYYMYRQSKSVGNLENVGWCKKDTECLYNIYMMEEIHTVLAVGGGAVTKLKAPYGSEIERIYNFKYPFEYISRFEEQNARKALIGEFYKKHAY